MPEIVLATLNARYIHAAFGLRYLHANLAELQPRSALLEFDLQQNPTDIVETILAQHPRIVGLGIYIWNVRQSQEVVALLKRLQPDLTVVLGGPEVSHETEHQEIVTLADHTLTGEADLAFANLCRSLLSPTPHPTPSSSPLPGIIHAPLPDLSQLTLPYEFYSDHDLAHRVLYVEASRGCPFSCEFCLSSLDLPVRAFPLEPFLAAMDRLLQRGARHFKFVDRTFNLHLATSRSILRFFRDRWHDGLFLHFEMIPDRLPEPLREEIAAFPPGALQFEIGIQSFNPEVCARISRRQNFERLEDNFRFLRQHTGVHLHADLIIGLPGESLDSFAAGFDRLVRLHPQEIQVGLLKRLRGTPIQRHDQEWSMRYNPHPPYELLANRDLDFPTLQRLRRFSRYWDLVANSGRFSVTLPLLWEPSASPFFAFLDFSDHLYATTRQTHALSPDRLAQSLFHWLTRPGHLSIQQVADALANDLRRSGRRDLPPWLESHLSPSPTTSRSPRSPRPPQPPALLPRQARHQPLPPMSSQGGDGENLAATPATPMQR